MGPVRFDARPAGLVLADTAESANGRLFARRGGGLEYNRRWVGATPPARWVWNASTPGVLDIAIVGAGSQAINTAEVTTHGGERGIFVDKAVTVENRWQMSDAPIGGLTGSGSLLAWLRAEREVFTRRPRSDWPERVEIRGQVQPTVVSTDIGDRVDVSWRPPWAGADQTAQCVVTGVDHTAGGAGLADWTTSLWLVPMRPERRRLDTGTAGAEGASTPDRSLLGNVDVRARVSFNNLDEVGLFRVAVCKYGTTASWSWLLAVVDRKIYWSCRASTGTIYTIAAPGIGGLADQPMWLRGVWDATADTMSAYTSMDGTAWVLLGALAIPSSAVIMDSASPIEVGVGTLDGAQVFWGNGSVYEMEMRTTIDSAVPVLRFDPMDGSSLSDTVWTSSTSSAGETWTVASGSTPLVNW